MTTSRPHGCSWRLNPGGFALDFEENVFDLRGFTENPRGIHFVPRDFVLDLEENGFDLRGFVLDLQENGFDLRGSWLSSMGLRLESPGRI